ncbi:flagellar filament capping protein FliD [Roseibium litorale]|uniref:Flagellar hook-associated protein 2 n=1 Tax=Roseibium litorale TaxID=2803841 RepID=A0ABR9CKE7_9HYPH|nr:flagellar filament capping protein FliD [Roseibium litorale]MBD8891320.1 flagellar filament capping protein FliD [Roseibium litorale]
MTTTTSTTSSTTTTSTSYSYSTSSSDTDWDALIEVAVAAKETRADSIDLKIEDNEATIAAYEEMQSLLQDIVSAAETIRGTADSLTANDDIFSTRAAYLTAVGDVDAESAVVVTAEADATITTYDLQILQLASAQKVAGTAVEDKTAELGLSGTFSIQLENAEAVDIEISEDMTLAEIAEAINLQSDTSGVSATVLEVSEGSFRLILSADETGQEIVLTDVSGDDVTGSLGLTDEDGSFTSELQEAQSAIITLDGIEITRTTNTIDDLIDGVTFNLYQETGEDNSISVEISNDLTSIKSAITALVDAYNAYREWAVTQQATSSAGGASDDAVLFGDSTLRAVNTAIADALSTVIDTDSMALLGLTYDESNYLVLDETTLNEALLEDVEAIEDLLAFQMTSTSTDIALLNRSSNMPESLSLDIEVDDEGNITSVSVDGDSSLFTISGSRINGAEGSIYEGITFVFTGDESQSVDLSFSSGIVEKLYSTIESYSNSDDGILEDMMTSLTETNEDLQEDADDIRSRAETYRDTLAARYAAYQVAIEEAESTLDYLEALLNSGSD